MYLNKAIIIGNLTRDPELRAIPSGMQVASFSLATNRYWKDKDGNKQEGVEYHNIVVFGKQAENVAKYLKKGSQALIEGRMQTRSWDATDGSGKKYRTEIIAETVQFGDRRDAPTGGSSSYVNKPVQSAPAGGQQENKGVDTIEYPEENINPEDIPF